MANDLIFDLVLLEADRVIAHRMKDFDLYYKDVNGSYESIGEAYSAQVDDLVSNIMKRKKMRYMITFVDAIDLQDELRPSSHRVLRFISKHMNYGNVLKGYGIRDINLATGLNTHYITSAIKELCGRDIIRFDVEKGRRTYMVNPIYFYKGSMKKLFYAVKEYEKMTARNEDLEEEYQPPKSIF
jgi:DNA-binding MarR family transcriptional regulator